MGRKKKQEIAPILNFIEKVTSGLSANPIVTFKVCFFKRSIYQIVFNILYTVFKKKCEQSTSLISSCTDWQW